MKQVIFYVAIRNAPMNNGGFPFFALISTFN
jgi:hypothetical protein